LTSIKSKSIFITFFFICLSIFLGCAEIVPPPGGEIDKTGPFLTSSLPASQAVNVDIGNKIELIFSETLGNLPDDNKGIFISPRQTVEPKIKLKSDKIIITLAENFLDNQTYVISLSSDIKDQRNNSLDSSTIIAFSTGPEIESNYLSGFVYDDNMQPLYNILVGLFKITDLSETINYDSTFPIYLTQVEKNGKFEFQYVSKKNYNLIAYEDYNKNKLFNPKEERFAVTDRPINFDSEERLDRLSLNLTRERPSDLEIISISLTRDNLVRLILSREINSELFINSTNNFIMVNLDDTSIVLSDAGIITSDKQYTSELTFYIPNLTNGRYNVKLLYSSDAPFAIFDNFELKLLQDKINPAVKSVHPSETYVHPKEFSPIINFTEPIDTSKVTSETFSLWNKDSGNRVEINVLWQNLLTAMITPVEIDDGSRYLFKITEFEISDLSGNLIGDSLLEYGFQTIDNDSLGEISGKVDMKLIQKAQDDIILELVALSTHKKYSLSADNGIFKIQLPSGDYLLKGFIDSNKNGVFDKGSLNPYIYSETSCLYPDTIRVRARFETSDINFIME